MNHLDAIDAGLKNNISHNKLVRKVFLCYPTKVFVGDEERQFEILNDVADHFGVSITCVQVAGSAKFGHSIIKKKDFEVGNSDLDLAIIDSQLFSDYMGIVLEVSDGYTDGAKFSRSNGRSKKEEYLKNLARGIFRPDLMPTGKERADWFGFFGRLSNKHSGVFKSISAAVYLSQVCFENKQKAIIVARSENKVV